MNDTELAAAINAHIQTNPYATRKKVITACRTSLERVKRLEAEGLVKLPVKLSRKLGAPMGRIAGGWGDRFSIKKRK